MAIRLVRWLGGMGGNERPAPNSLADAAAYHLREGGHIDWARLSLGSGDAVGELSEAYAELFERATEARENQAKRFAILLNDWTAAGSTGKGVVPVERILESIVAPLAPKSPVLLLVMDGMSVAVCHELLSDVTRQDWVVIRGDDQPPMTPGLATIPCVTEVSRTSP